MNKLIDKKYRVSYNIEDLPRTVTVLDNSKSTCLSKLTKALTAKNTDDAIDLAIELSFSGYSDQIIKKIVDFYIKNINLAQPRGILYISDFYTYYNNKYDKSNIKKHKLLIINDQVVRNFISNLITLICGSNQRKLLSLVKITDKDFDLNKKKDRLVSKNLELVSKFLGSGDNKNIIIPLSEIITLFTCHYIKNREQKIIYWLSWLLEYEKVFHEGTLEVNNRNVPGVESKFTKDYLWIIWEMLNKSINDHHVKRFIFSLEAIYKDNFTAGNRKKKISLLIFAILIYINPMPKLTFPHRPIEPLLFYNMQYETILVNLKYFEIKKQLMIENL